MGGKTKTSQRTKNNVRPSSSGRSAELLSNSGISDTIFSGTASTVKPLPALFPTLASTNLDQGLTPEYLVCFKKFNKKDPITKTKALQELTELLKTGNVEDAEAALLSWTHYYQFLTVDCDRRVREATQVCHGALVGACGRRVAPQLRRLLPVWLLVQHDEHGPISYLAQTHLQNTFPEIKMSEALSYCKSEIMSLLVANLTGSADAMIGKRVEDPDEKEAQISRILASSLRALESFLAKLAAAQDDWLWDALAPLLQRGFFWGLVRNPAQNIRAAWYGALGVVLRRFAARLSPDAGRRLARTLLAEPEREPTAAAQRWAALLILMTTVKEWHTWLDKKDLLITRLLDAVENGGWGAARALAGLLAALLAHLPSDLLTKHFYITFFNATFTGLNNKQLLSSKSERQTWVSGISECLQQLSTQPYEYTVEVVTYAHRTWLETLLDMKGSPTKTNLIKYSMGVMVALVKFWVQGAKDVRGDKDDQLTRNFWQNFGSTIVNQVDNLSVDREDIERVLESHTLLLITLHKELLQETKKKFSIKFEDDPKAVDLEKEPVDRPAAGNDTPKFDPALMERLKHNLNGLAERTCCVYFDFAYTKQVSSAVCPFLAELLTAFESEVLFITLARHYGGYTIYCFYDKILLSWLASDTMRCAALADIVFLVVKYLTEDEQEAMFHSFQLFPPVVVEWCLSRALAPPHRQREAARRWLRGGVASAAVLALLGRGQHALLLECLAPDDNGEVLVSEHTVRSAALWAGAWLQAAGPRMAAGLPEAARFAAQLAAALARGALLPQSVSLLVALFRTYMQLFRAGAHDTEGGRAVLAAWQATVRTLPGARRGALLLPALEDVADHVFGDLLNFEPKLIADIASFCPFLICTSDVDELNIDDIIDDSEKLLSYVESTQPWVPLDLYALRCDCVLGNITPVYINVEEHLTKISATCADDHDELTRSDYVIFAYGSMFRAFFIRAITRSAPDEKKLDTGSTCELVLEQKFFKEQFARVLYDYVLITTLYERYAFWPHYELIKQTKEAMDNALDDILTNISLEIKDALLLFLTEDFTKNIQHYAIYARKVFEIKFNEVAAKATHTQNTPESANNSFEVSESNSEAITTRSAAEVSEERTVSEDVLDGDDRRTASKDCQPDQIKTGVEPKTVQTNSSTVVSDQNDCRITSVQNDSKIGSNNSEIVLRNDDTKVKSDRNDSEVDLDTDDFQLKSNEDSFEAALNENHSETESGQIEPHIVLKDNSEVEPDQNDSEHSADQNQSQVLDDVSRLVQNSSPHVPVQWMEMFKFDILKELSLQADAKYSPCAERDLKTRYVVMMRTLVSAHGALAQRLLADACRGAPYALDAVLYCYYRDNHIMLFEKDLTEASWPEVASNVAIVDFMSELVGLRGIRLPTHCWDFINITLSSLLDSISRTKHRWGCTNVAALLRAAGELLRRVRAVQRQLRAEREVLLPAGAALVREWDEIFAPSVHGSLGALLLHVLRSTETPLTGSSAAALAALLAALPAEWGSTAPGGAQPGELARAASAALLTTRPPPYKYLAYRALRLLADPLVRDDELALKQWSAADGADDAEGARPPPALCLELFDDALQQLQELTEAALSNVKLCEGTCQMVPCSDSHCVALGYLLLAAAVLQLGGLARGDLAQMYIDHIRRNKYAEGLMSCALRLLPGAVAAFAFKGGAAPSERALRPFAEPPALDVLEWCDGATLGALACYALTECVEGAGGAVLGWSGAASARVAGALRRLVRLAVGPVLLRRQLRQLRAAPAPDNATITVLARGEVQCRVLVDERPLELTVQLAAEHPLVPPVVTTSPHSPLADTSFIVKYLTYQNGSLASALGLWARALSARVQSYSQCYICYCRLHPASGRLPRVRCHQCRNNFHYVCLNKWFETSNKSTCPLCRSKF